MFLHSLQDFYALLFSLLERCMKKLGSTIFMHIGEMRACTNKERWCFRFCWSLYVMRIILSTHFIAPSYSHRVLKMVDGSYTKRSILVKSVLHNIKTFLCQSTKWYARKYMHMLVTVTSSKRPLVSVDHRFINHVIAPPAKLLRNGYKFLKSDFTNRCLEMSQHHGSPNFSPDF